MEHGEKILLGVIVEERIKGSYQACIASINEAYRNQSPAKQVIEHNGMTLPINIEKTFGRHLPKLVEGSIPHNILK